MPNNVSPFARVGADRVGSSRSQRPRCPTFTYGQNVRWRDYTGQFYRVHHDDRSLAFIVIGPRTYRAPLSELR